MLHAQYRATIAKSEPLHFDVPTATAITIDKDDPYKVLLAYSAKHQGRVCPGGKIDQADIISVSMIECARRCVVREVSEETGAEAICVEHIATLSDRARDVREINFEKLIGTLAEVGMKNVSTDCPIIAHYGVPDFIFIVTVDKEAVRATDELVDPQWFDIRDLEIETPKAGHDRLLELYRARLSRTNNTSRM